MFNKKLVYIQSHFFHKNKDRHLLNFDPGENPLQLHLPVYIKPR